MSDSVHMTVKQAVKESGYDYGTPEFKEYVFEHNIELLAKKISLKKEARRKKQEEKFTLKNS